MAFVCLVSLGAIYRRHLITRHQYVYVICRMLVTSPNRAITVAQQNNMEHTSTGCLQNGTATANCCMSVHTKLFNSHRTNFRENRYADFQDNLPTKSKFLKSDKSNDIMHEDRRTVTTMALTSSGLPTFLVLLRPQMLLLLTACLLARSRSADISYWA